MITAPVLFARARKEPYQSGPHRCFYCLASCDASYLSAGHVKASFTSRDTVGGGGFVCGGCVAAMNERASVLMPNGEIRTGAKTRSYSWVLTSRRAVAASKAHREFLLSACLRPPKSPFVICLSDSGQKHLLYRAVVCYGEPLTVTLEGERITYRPSELRERLSLANRISAAIGKPALRGPLSIGAQLRLARYHGDPAIVAEWLTVSEQPLTRLAAWFAKPKEEACLEYPEKDAAAKQGGRKTNR